MKTSLDLSLGFQAANDIAVFPSDFVSNASDLAVFAVRAKAKDFHCKWDADTLLLVVWWRNAFEYLQAGEGDLSAACSVWNHA
jgi:hypothetical protein